MFGVFGTMIALTADFELVLGLRFLQGVGFACLTPIIVTALGVLYDGTTETTAQGLRFASSGFSQTVFPLVAGVLVVGVAWQVPFLLYAMAIPVALLVLVFFEESRPMTADGGTVDEPVRLRRYVGILYGSIRQPPVTAILLARLVPQFLFVILLTYSSFIVVRLAGGTPSDAGFVVAAASITYAVAATQVGRIERALGNRTLILLIAHGFLLFGAAAAAFATSVTVVTVGAVATGTGFGTSVSLYRSIITGLAPGKYRGGLVSVSESLSRLTVTVTPVVVGACIDFGTAYVGFSVATRWSILGLGAVSLVAGSGAVLVTSRGSSVVDP